jgi:hypothetical protein
VLQDVTSHARILGDPLDRGHAKVLQNLGHVPDYGCQPLDLDNAFCLGVLKKPLELNELHQLIAVVLGVESPGLRLFQYHLVKV